MESKLADLLDFRLEIRDEQVEMDNKGRLQMSIDGNVDGEITCCKEVGGKLVLEQTEAKWELRSDTDGRLTALDGARVVFPLNMHCLMAAQIDEEEALLIIKLVK